MYEGSYFYHKSIRNYTVLFGSVFNDVTIERYKKDGSLDTSFRVPLTYASKDKFIAKLNQKVEDTSQTSNPNIQNTLPRMSFVLNAMTFDSTRKTSSLNSIKSDIDSGTSNRSYNAVPYDLNYELFIVTDNTDDGLQIVEQIVPNFTPSLNLSIFETDMKIKRDVKIIMNDVTVNDDYEGGFENKRLQEWFLSFTLKGYLYPQVGIIDRIENTTVNILDLDGNPWV